MKKLLTLLLIVLTCWTTATYATMSITLAWCPSSDTNAIGYRVYYGSGKKEGWRGDLMDTNQSACPGVILIPGTNLFRNYSNVIDVGRGTTFIETNGSATVQATVTNLNERETYYFAVVCYDSDGMESDWSNEIEFIGSYSTNLPPSKPQQFQHTIKR